MKHIFQVADVTLMEDTVLEKYKIDVVKSSKHPCPRCRRVQSDGHNILCQRCLEVVTLLNENTLVILN